MIDSTREYGEAIIRGLRCPGCGEPLAWNGAVGPFCANGRCSRFDELPELQDEIQFRRALNDVARSK